MTDEGTEKVVELALELGVEPDVVERELGADVFRAGGFRVTSASKAAELISRHEMRRREAEESSKRRAAEARARAAEVRQAGIERGRAAREAAAKGESQIQRMAVAKLTELPGTGDVPAVAAMLADAAPTEFEGGVSTPRPGHIDWLTGAAETGGTFGPPPRRRKNERS